MKILIINGVNMDMLGTREPEKYGSKTLADLETDLKAFGEELGAQVETFQSNSEGEIVEKIHKTDANGIVINAGAYTHTSVAIADALSAVKTPAVEVHMTNIYSREEFRHKSYLAPVCVGQISGFGANSYKLGLRALVEIITKS